jgi:hypothetical protein
MKQMEGILERKRDGARTPPAMEKVAAGVSREH